MTQSYPGLFAVFLKRLRVASEMQDYEDTWQKTAARVPMPAFSMLHLCQCENDHFPNLDKFQNLWYFNRRG